MNELAEGKRRKRGSGPQCVRFFGAVLESLQELGGSGRATEITDLVVKKLRIPDEELSQTLKNGASRIANQIAWARFYLMKDGYIDANSAHGVWSLTTNGLKATLSHEEAHVVFRRIQGSIKQARDHTEVEQPESGGTTDTPAQESPVVWDDLYRGNLLEILKALSPQGFERLCQRLLRESNFEQVTVTGRTGDGGIDGHGILKLNPFVSFRVFFQCKRYSGSVGAAQIRDFRGALMGRADKGILITTGTFTAEAKQEASRDGALPIELVDGAKIVDMFSDLSLGVRTRTIYEVDETFFEQFA